MRTLGFMLGFSFKSDFSKSIDLTVLLQSCCSFLLPQSLDGILCSSPTLASHSEPGLYRLLTVPSVRPDVPTVLQRPNLAWQSISDKHSLGDSDRPS